MKVDIFLFILFSLGCIDASAFGFVIPLLPEVILADGISLSVLGFILSFYPIGYFIVSVIFGKILHKYSKIKMLYCCQFLFTVSNLIFSVLPLIHSSFNRIIIAILARSLQGIGIGGAASILYTFIPEKYPDNIEEAYGYLEIAIGSGVVCGSIFAGFLYEYTSYSFSFFFMSLIYAISSVILVRLLNNKLEEAKRMQMRTLLETIDSNMVNSVPNFDCFCNGKSNDELSFSVILKNRNFLIIFLCQCFCFTTITLIHPSLTEHVKSYGGSSQDIGFIFAACDFTYASTVIFILKYFLRFGRKNIILFGGLMACVGLLIIGPEQYTFLPANLFTVGFGMALNGFAQVFFTVPIIPEYIAALEDIYGKNCNINEMASGMFNAGYAISEFTGPILGGILANYLGVCRGMSIYAILLLLYLKIYWSYNNASKETKNNESMKFEKKMSAPVSKI